MVVWRAPHVLALVRCPECRRDARVRWPERWARCDACGSQCYADRMAEPCHCGEPLVCLICDTCAEHCATDGGPDACWEAHESWRLGRGDPSLGAGAKVTHPRPGTVGPAPRPLWVPTAGDRKRAHAWLLQTNGSLYPASVWDARIEGLAIEFAKARAERK